MKFLILKLAFLFLAAGLLGIGATNSFLSDTETSVGNTFVVAESFCTPTDGGPFWASSVISSSQGLRKNGTPVLPGRSNSNDALGAPNGVGNPASGFFSLGFGGNIVLQFSSPVYNGTGADLSFHEITNSRNTYPLEQANVEVSSNGTTWYLIGEATSEPPGDGVVYLDISSNASAPPVVNFIRITDTTNPAIHSSDADGYDLDAVDATNLCITPSSSPTPEPTSSPTPTPTSTPTPTPTPTPITNHLVINEVYYDTSVSGEGDEFVEIYNPTLGTIDLTDYKIGDEETKGEGEGMYRFPAGTLISSGQFMVIARKATVFKSTFGFNPDFEWVSDDAAVPDMIKYTDWAAGYMDLANGGDEILLLDKDDLAVDVVTYGSGAYVGVIPHPGVSSGHSIGRSPIGVDTDNCSVDFIDQTNPTPGS